jgi:DNA-binding MarR family transcriptional regulator
MRYDLAPPRVLAAGLTDAEMAILRLLGPAGARGETSSNAIGEETGVDSHRLHGVLIGLVGRRLVWRRTATSWSITAAGLKIVGLRD